MLDAWRVEVMTTVDRGPSPKSRKLQLSIFTRRMQEGIILTRIPHSLEAVREEHDGKRMIKKRGEIVGGKHSNRDIGSSM